MPPVLKALLAGSVIVLFCAAPACAGGLAEANDLIGQANAPSRARRALDVQAGLRLPDRRCR